MPKSAMTALPFVRNAIRGFGSLCVLAAVATSVTPAAMAQTKVTVAQSSQSLSFSVLYVAQKLGYFKDEGLDVDLVVAGGSPKALAALVGGSAQFAVGVLSDAIAARRKGLNDISEIAALVNGYTMPLLIREKVAAARKITATTPIAERIAALKGLRVGVTTPGAGRDLLVRYLAISNGLRPDTDLEILPVGGLDTTRAAMQTGRIDVCTCLPPVDVIMMKSGVAIPFLDPAKEIPSLRGVHFVTIHASKSWSATNPAAALAFMRAIVRSERLISGDSHAAREAVRSYFPQFDADTLNASWDAIYPQFAGDIRLTDDGVQKELDFEKVFAPENGGPTLAIRDLIDNLWVDKAEMSLK
jgi:NitT/TauT family transport system substrate-binding protein